MPVKNKTQCSGKSRKATINFLSSTPYPFESGLWCTRSCSQSWTYTQAGPVPCSCWFWSGLPSCSGTSIWRCTGSSFSLFLRFPLEFFLPLDLNIGKKNGRWGYLSPSITYLVRLWLQPALLFLCFFFFEDLDSTTVRIVSEIEYNKTRVRIRIAFSIPSPPFPESSTSRQEGIGNPARPFCNHSWLLLYHTILTA